MPEPDKRYKVDILVIVGHPDDDTEVAAYLVKASEQEHKRAAVVYTTRGNTGGNAVGEEQANALADIREMEARHSLASYGVTLAWFLHGSDMPGADVLHSLEQWGHGKALDEVVRLVRITRPEVILTWMPNYDVGENHEDPPGCGGPRYLKHSTLPQTRLAFLSRSRRRAIGRTLTTTARGFVPGSRKDLVCL
jgi:LmbE family N-acetylglucosaminyl deacetylase